MVPLMVVAYTVWVHHLYHWLKHSHWAALWLTGVATAVLAAGVLLAWSQLKDSRRDRHIQILSDFGRRWDSERLVEARTKQATRDSQELADEVGRWLKKATDAPEVRTLLRVPNFFEDLAIMVDLGELKIKFVAKAFKATAEREWAYWKDAIAAMRTDSPESYKQFQALVEKLAKCKLD